MAIQRRRFIVTAASGALLAGCGGGGDGDGPVAPGAGCNATIEANHGHRLTMPAADLDAATPRSYSILGTAGHDHTVTLGLAELAALKAGQPVTVSSTSGPGHEHGVTIGCV